MNFLSHYYLDKQAKSPYYVCGLVLPDLVRIANKDTRISLAPISNGSKEHNELAMGCLRHLKVDAIWHNSFSFDIGKSKMKELIQKAEIHNLNRPSFFAHIFLELMLDRCLLVEDINLGKGFFTKLEQVEISQLLGFLGHNGFSESEQGHFLSFFQHFLEAKPPLRYTDDVVLCKILENIYERGSKESIQLHPSLLLVAEQIIGEELPLYFQPFFEKELI